MSDATRDGPDHADQLRIVRDIPGAASETFLILGVDGRATAFNGHVDLGTGIGTALGQIVAEELDLAFERVTVVLGDTARTPDQGPTIASETIQVSAKPLRWAAATARRALLARAAERLALPVAGLRIEDGVVIAPSPDNRALSFGDLIAGAGAVLRIDPDAPLKPPGSYRVVGQPMPRVDLPAKAVGGLVYVHDMRLPGMLHGRVVRPPYAGRDAGPFVGTSLIAIDEASIADIPGIVGTVVIGDFIGIVAEREEQAARAAGRLRTSWKPLPALPDLTDIATALRANPSTPRELLRRGDVEAARAAAATPLDRTYVWPYQLHGSIGPSCSLADWRPDGLTLWSGTQNPRMLRADLARLLGMAETAIDVIRMEAAGCYGRNCADDVGGDAALLSRAVGRPVRVQLSREQETAWEPKGAAQLMEVRGGLTSRGDVAAYDFSVRYPSNGAPLLASLLTGIVAPVPMVSEMGDRTAIPPYGYEAMLVTAHDMPPILRASWLRGVSAMPNSFAHECWIDEAAASAGVDPIDYRLRYLEDPRGADLVRAMADRTGWVPHTAPGSLGGAGDILRGRGFAYALYTHGKFPGTPAAWAAWVADVEVNTATGDVALTRVTVGQDAGLMINPAGVRHQIHGNVIQSISRVMKEAVAFTPTAVETREWGGYPIVTFPEVPPIDVLMLPRPGQPPMGVGESASVPSAAAIANAIYDATGVRFRELPFTPERIRAGLAAAGLATTPLVASPLSDGGIAPQAGALPPRSLPPPASGRKRGFWAGLGLGVGLAGLAVTALPLRAAIAPVAPPDASLYSAATIAHGRMLAALGDCAVCHTAPGGHSYAEGPALSGGLGIETPFGTVYSRNITPDRETGIGNWSYAAFARAMREGISRDGSHLYPVFPYTNFTRASDDDLQALYAYLMSRPAVSALAPRAALAFPMNFRPVMAAWNFLYLRPGAYRPDPARPATWNRGAYLVEGLGHCGGCHTPRNALGAEIASKPLAGGWAEGWEAPPLNGLSHAPIPWSEAELYTYLRTGHSALHGPAAGAMGPVVREMAALPDSDLRAMAAYLASLGPVVPPEAEARLAAEITARTPDAMRASAGPGARLYQGACAVCHEPGAPPQFGVQPNLAFNTNLQSARPDNLIRTILEGIQAPALDHLGAMPGFAASLTDGQIAELAGSLRRRYAPDKTPWADLPQAVSRLRAASGS